MDFNSYFASIEQQIQPELRGKPIAVVPLETDATCAIAASYEAKAYGIKTGTRIFEAKRLCPDLICVLADHSRYVHYHHLLLEEIERHIPITQVASIDEVACELDVSQQNVETATKLAHAIKKGINDNVGTAIKCSIGLAPNRFLAKIASDMQKPDGLTVIEPQDIPAKLLPVPFSDVPGIGKNMQLRLSRLGIFSMTDLYKIPPKHLRAIWHSVAGEQLYYKLRGVEIESPETKRSSIGHSNMLAPENRNAVSAKKVSQRLLLKAASRLRRMEYHSTALTVSARTVEGMHCTLDQTHEPRNDNAQFVSIWRGLWEQLLKQTGRKTPVFKKVSITMHGLMPSADVQVDLFSYQKDEPKAPKRSEKLSAAMDALNHKFGRNTITMAATLGDANKVTGTKVAFGRIPDSEEFLE